MITFYQIEWCPECHAVRQTLTELGLTYTIVNVPAAGSDRKQVIEISGQESVPVLVDGEEVFRGTDEVIRHLRGSYPPAADAGDHAKVALFRKVVRLDVEPAVALERLRETLASEKIVIVAEIPGEAIAPGRLPDGYLLLQAASPVTARRVVGSDPSVPAAVTIPISVYPSDDGGTEIAATRPTATAWLYSDSGLLPATRELNTRVRHALEAL